MIDLAIAAHDEGDYFPIWAVCNGFELLNTYISGNPQILGHGFKDDSETRALQSVDMTF